MREIVVKRILGNSRACHMLKSGDGDSCPGASAGERGSEIAHGCTVLTIIALFGSAGEAMWGLLVKTHRFGSVRSAIWGLFGQKPLVWVSFHSELDGAGGRNEGDVLENAAKHQVRA